MPSQPDGLDTIQPEYTMSSQLEHTVIAVPNARLLPKTTDCLCCAGHTLLERTTLTVSAAARSQMRACNLTCRLTASQNSSTSSDLNFGVPSLPPRHPEWSSQLPASESILPEPLQHQSCHGSVRMFLCICRWGGMHKPTPTTRPPHFA